VSDGAIADAERAFERGDWREARRIAASVQPPTDASRAMLARFAVDPLAVVLVALSVALLLYSCARYL